MPCIVGVYIKGDLASSLVYTRTYEEISLRGKEGGIMALPIYQGMCNLSRGNILPQKIP